MLVADRGLIAKIKIPSVGSRPIRLVLDTNVVLDCLLFCDSPMRDLTTAIETGVVQALVHQPAIEELERVLAYPQFRRAAIEQRQILDHYLSMVTFAPMPDTFCRSTLLLPSKFPRCRDRDDELFLALAYHARADGLVTKDRAILKLRNKARRFGVEILAPAQLSL